MLDQKVSEVVHRVLEQHIYLRLPEHLMFKFLKFVNTGQLERSLSFEIMKEVQDHYGKI